MNISSFRTSRRPDDFDLLHVYQAKIVNEYGKIYKSDHGLILYTYDQWERWLLLFYKNNIKAVVKRGDEILRSYMIPSNSPNNDYLYNYVVQILLKNKP